MSTERTRRATKEILISMSNMMAAVKEAEENLADNDLRSFCGSLRRVEQISKSLRGDVELKYGVDVKT